MLAIKPSKELEQMIKQIGVWQERDDRIREIREARTTKEKAMQTEWTLIAIDIEDSQKPNREFLLNYIARHHFFAGLKDQFKVPPIISPIKEYVTRIEETTDDWRTWKVGEFMWKNNQENTEPNGENMNARNEQDKQRGEKRKQVINGKEKPIETKTKKLVRQCERSKEIDEIKKEGEAESKQKQTKLVMRISERDLMTLDNDNWLNDEVVNCYLQLIAQRGNMSQNKYKTVYAMDTYFFPRLHINGYSAIKRWTKKLNVFAFQIILVPINLGNHWCLSIIDLEKKRIRHFDSFTRENPRYFETLLEYMQQEAVGKNVRPIIRDEWKLKTEKDIPKQNNGNDCGVFMCTYAEYVTADREMNFTQKDIPGVRAKMRMQIARGKLE
ncbi:sentrin-specific protease 1-like [Venturia canescens]|uniref:sentrin-specific protease 1-like n=1 Tax=Venturia canescens TaxID=32260 RepID=UPI001C9D3BD5|nr:sentrin-specific protease 1-like [Venturia canescens]